MSQNKDNSSIQNNKRLVKNTLFLYVRMAVTMIITLFTSRIILDILGVEDYGIYNVVGGVIVLFSFFNQSLSTATQRYLSFEIGKKNNTKLTEIFNVSIIIYLSVIVLILLLGESFGLWFLNHKMNFPQERLEAANWVYQFSIFSMCFNIIRAPFNANIISNEKMAFFAYTSIVESIGKLIIVFALITISFDKLKTYAVLMFGISFIITIWYIIYNFKGFDYIKISKVKEKILFKELIGFTGWGIFGSIANVGFRQGINVLINLFYGVAFNAAFGIANNVSAMVTQFVSGFQSSLNPQLTKVHAAGDVDAQNKLIYRSAKFSFFLIYIAGLPILLNTNFLLDLWLKSVPDYSTLFSQLMIIGLMVEALSAPLWVIIFATGKIQTYQIVISLTLLSNVFFSYLVGKLGYGPEYMLYIRISIFFLCLCIRLYFVKILISFKVKAFIQKVLLPVISTIVITFPLPLYVSNFYENLTGFIYTLLTSLIITGCAIYTIGLDKHEKIFINNFTKNKLLKKC